MKLGDVVYHLDFILKFNPQTIFRHDSHSPVDKFVGVQAPSDLGEGGDLIT